MRLIGPRLISLSVSELRGDEAEDSGTPDVIIVRARSGSMTNEMRGQREKIGLGQDGKRQGVRRSQQNGRER
jgi:hypothetical protein